MLAHHALAWATLALARGLTRGALVPAAARESTRWFAEHALVNAVLAGLTLPALAACLADPAGSARHGEGRAWATSAYPACLALWLHAYHVALYDLTRADVFHHAVFAVLLGLPAWWYAWGSLCNALLFFLCGLPGGAIYGLLAARRCGALTWVHEPTYSAAWNAVRCPGILACAACLGATCLAGAPPAAPAWAIAVQLTLAPVNAVYYAKESVQRARRQAS